MIFDRLFRRSESPRMDDRMPLVCVFSPLRSASAAFFVSESAALYSSTSFFSVAFTWMRLPVVFLAVVAGFFAAGFFAVVFFAVVFLLVDVDFPVVFFAVAIIFPFRCLEYLVSS